MPCRSRTALPGRAISPCQTVLAGLPSCASQTLPTEVAGRKEAHNATGVFLCCPQGVTAMGAGARHCVMLACCYHDLGSRQQPLRHRRGGPARCHPIGRAPARWAHTPPPLRPERSAFAQQTGGPAGSHPRRLSAGARVGAFSAFSTRLALCSPIRVRRQLCCLGRCSVLGCRLSEAEQTLPAPNENRKPTCEA